MLIGRSQATVVYVDLHPGREVVVHSDRSRVAEDEEESSTVVRVSMCQGGPGARCAGVPTTTSLDSDLGRTNVLEGSVASGSPSWGSGARATVSSFLEGKISL